jgi:hypothetical protein
MHSVLFVARPDRGSAFWRPFLENVDVKLERTAGIARLAENVSLLDLTESVEALGLLIYQAGVLGIRYGILPFADPPQWLPASFCPKTILARSE